MSTATLLWWVFFETWVILTQKSPVEEITKLPRSSCLFFHLSTRDAWRQNICFIFLTLEIWKHYSIAFYCSPLLGSLLCALIVGVIYKQRFPNGNLIPTVNGDEFLPAGLICSSSLFYLFLPFQHTEWCFNIQKVEYWWPKQDSWALFSGLLKLCLSNSFNICASWFLHLIAK